MISPELRSTLVAVSAGSVLFCTAVNCYTYCIAYPLWRSVGKAEFPILQAEYMRRLPPVITFPHILAFLSTGALAFLRPTWLSAGTDLYLFSAVTIVILLSALVAGPVHGRFERHRSIDERGMRLLIRVSAIRSILLLLASVLLLREMVMALPQ